MRRSDTDLSEEAEEQVDVDQDLQDEALADVKLDDDGDDDDKLANAPAWVRYMPKTGWKHQSSSSTIVPVKATSTKYGKNKFCDRSIESKNHKNRLSHSSPCPTKAVVKKKTNIHEVSLLLGYLK